MLLPKSKNIESEPIGDKIIGMRPDEKWKDAVARHLRGRLIKSRNLKISKILKRKGK